MGKELKVLKKPYNGICIKSFRLFKVRVYEDHTILSVFQHAEGTNYSSRERIACLHLYMIAVMASTAVFYVGGSATVKVGDLMLSLCASLACTIPVVILRLFFQSSRPRLPTEWDIEELMAREEDFLEKWDFFWKQKF